MDCKIIYRLFFLIIFLTSTNLKAIEFKGMINSFINKVGDEVLPDTLLQITEDKEKII